MCGNVTSLRTDLPVHCVNHDDKLHWLCHPLVYLPNDPSKEACPPHRLLEEEGSKILAFDTVRETFRRIPRPPARRNRDGRLVCNLEEQYSLLEVEGKVAMADARNDCLMDIWVLQDYDKDGESWALRLRVDGLHLPQRPRWVSCWWLMNAGVEGRAVVVIGDCRSNPCWAWLYDVAEKRVLKRLQIDDFNNELAFRESTQRHAFFDPSSALRDDA